MMEEKMVINLLFYFLFLYSISIFIIIVCRSWAIGLELKNYLYENNRITDINYLRIANRESKYNIGGGGTRWFNWIKSIDLNESNNTELILILNKYKKVYLVIKLSGFGLLTLLLMLGYLVSC